MKKPPSLALCILFDVIGCATYLLPFLGEWFDVAWAPISAIIFFVMFKGMRGAVGAVVNFIEEILPGADIIPTFTIAWFLQQQAYKQSLQKKPTVITIKK